MQPLRMLLEKPISEDLEYIIEESNNRSERSVFIKGPFLMAGKPNLNERVYDLNEMVSEVGRYMREFVSCNRALGELNHPQESVEVDLGRACHMVVSLEQKDNIFMGKSKVLSTPTGSVLKQLISDGIKVGISSRALGQLVAEGAHKKVKNLKLLALDIVHTPSYTDAMLESVMESRQYIITEGGKIVELACDSLECKLNQIPKKDVNVHLQEAFASFINQLKGK